MKFSADASVSMTTIRWLREQGYDAVHLRDEGLERLPDNAIMQKARDEGRVVMTFDLDFQTCWRSAFTMLRASSSSVYIMRLPHRSIRVCSPC